MGPADLVIAVGHDQQRPHSGQPAREVADQIQGCLVRPMQILEDQHAHSTVASQLGENTVEQLTGRGTFAGPCQVCPTASPSLGTTSNNGNNGLGELSGSHEPTKKRAALCIELANRRTIEVFPTRLRGKQHHAPGTLSGRPQRGAQSFRASSRSSNSGSAALLGGGDSDSDRLTAAPPP